jgi:hypothetical protein
LALVLVELGEGEPRPIGRPRRIIHLHARQHTVEHSLRGGAVGSRDPEVAGHLVARLVVVVCIVDSEGQERAIGAPVRMRLPTALRERDLGSGRVILGAVGPDQPIPDALVALVQRPLVHDPRISWSKGDRGRLGRRGLCRDAFARR